MYYFAYGSNMSEERIRENCKNPKFVDIGYIKDYKFVYDGYSIRWGGAVANIIPKKGEIVWGVIYEISEDDLKALDRQEGYPKTYDRKEITVFCVNKNIEIKAYVYLREGEPAGKPAKEYVDTCVKGAKEHGIPEDYIKNVLMGW